MRRPKQSNYLFEKRYNFVFDSPLLLPDSVYNTPEWSSDVLETGKAVLNHTKSRLNAFDLDEWSKHTKRRDPSSYLTRFIKQRFNPEFVTQAWCKFYEILWNFDLVKIGEQLRSCHLCEAPGAFISALNHYLAVKENGTRWTWMGNSLNPYYEGNDLMEMIPDDRLLRHSFPNWYFGADFTGDITRFANYQDLVQKTQEKVDLVTADGSKDCSFDPGNQESHVAYLQYCETLTALSILKTKGRFVLKIFTMFEPQTVCLLYLLCASFRKVSIFKPAASKGGNSEVYVICLAFKGFEIFDQIWEGLLQPFRAGNFPANTAMFEGSTLSTFLPHLLKCSQFFTAKQITTINENIDYFRDLTRSELGTMHQLKVTFANKFINKYKVQSIPEFRKLLPGANLDFVKPKHWIFGINPVIVTDFSGLVLDDLNVITGAKIPEVKSSRFFPGSVKIPRDSKEGFYLKILSELSGTCLVLSGDPLMHKEIFYRVFTTKKSNILVKLPLLTNFLVGLVYIFVVFYQRIYFHKSGFLLLSDPTGDCLRKVQEALSGVHEVYDGLGEERDVLQVVLPKVLYETQEFFELVWNYNHVVLGTNKL